MNGAAISGPTNRSRPRRGGIAGRGEACDPQGTENTVNHPTTLSRHTLPDFADLVRREARASGFIIKADGTIVTNNHVVAGVMVTRPTAAKVQPGPSAAIRTLISRYWSSAPRGSVTAVLLHPLPIDAALPSKG